MGEKGNICPILEPLSNNAFTRNALLALITAKVRFIFITNPQHGDFAGKKPVELYGSILEQDMFQFKEYSPALIVDEHTTPQEIQAFIDESGELWMSVIYRGEPSSQEALNLLLSEDRIYDHIFIEGRSPKDLQGQFSKRRTVVIRDGFKKEDRNADYSPSDFFTDMNTTAGNPDEIGWGDFSIVGDKVSDGSGGPAHSVAIHHVNIRHDKGGSMWCDHFVEIGETPADTKGKTVRAMKRLSNQLGSLYPNNTEACAEWIKLARDENSKNLGYLKKLSIKHHFEIILES